MAYPQAVKKLLWEDRATESVEWSILLGIMAVAVIAIAFSLGDWAGDQYDEFGSGKPKAPSNSYSPADSYYGGGAGGGHSGGGSSSASYEKPVIFPKAEGDDEDPNDTGEPSVF